MLLTSRPYLKIFQILFCDLNATMTHQTRELVNLTTLLQVHASKSMPKGMSRNTYTLYTNTSLYSYGVSEGTCL